MVIVCAATSNTSTAILPATARTRGDDQALSESSSRLRGRAAASNAFPAILPATSYCGGEALTTSNASTTILPATSYCGGDLTTSNASTTILPATSYCGSERSRRGSSPVRTTTWKPSARLRKRFPQPRIHLFAPDCGHARRSCHLVTPARA
jgi:hypothetical protein